MRKLITIEFLENGENNNIKLLDVTYKALKNNILTN